MQHIEQNNNKNPVGNPGFSHSVFILKQYYVPGIGLGSFPHIIP
jgi:hypothetical protein